MTAALFISQTAAILFNTYISARIGAEGMGIYRLVITVYSFCAAFATSGITLAVTRLVTDYLAFDRCAEAKKAVKICMAAGVAVSSGVSVALFIFSERIGSGFLGDGRTVLSLKVLSLSLPFMAVSACIRGYFLAVRSVLKSASEQLLEQLVQIGVCAGIITSFCERGLEYACCAVAIGTAVSEIASCIYSAALYVLDIRKLNCGRGRVSKSMVHKLIEVALPVTGSSCLRSGLSMFENTLIPVGLQRYGCSLEQALSEYGLIMGMTMPALMFPSICLASLSSLIIPEISQAKAENRADCIARMSRKLIIASILFIVPTTLFFLIFGDELSRLLYKRDDVGVYIRILALTIPFSYIDKVVDGILKGMNQQLHYFIYNIIDSVIRVILAVALIPRMGVRGVIVIMFVSAVLNSTLSAYRAISVVCK